jgi:hypothetical protein
MSLKAISRMFAVLLVTISLYSIRAAAQDDAPSVAEAARRARQQKHDAAKPAQVIDNDTLAPASSATTPATASSTAAPAASDTKMEPPADSAASSDKPKTESDKSDEDAKKAEIEALKQQIADMKGKVDLQQREIALQQDSYFSNPDHQQDTAGKEKLDSMQTDLAQAKSQLADLLAKIAALAPDATDAKTPESTPSKQ